MAKYKITAIDEAKGHVTFQCLKNDGTVLSTETRGDLPIEDKEAVDAELSRYATEIANAAKSARKADVALVAIVGTEQTAKVA
jgi:hypothetical protein